MIDDPRATGSFKFFTITDVAEIADVAPRTVRRWLKSGDLVATALERS